MANKLQCPKCDGTNVFKARSMQMGTDDATCNQCGFRWELTPDVPDPKPRRANGRKSAAPRQQVDPLGPDWKDAAEQSIEELSIYEGALSARTAVADITLQDGRPAQVQVVVTADERFWL